MASGRFTEENAAFGAEALNEWKSGFHTEDGFAVPNRFEAIITPPRNMVWSTRDISLRCESVNLPGINLNTSTDTNIYGPTREIVDGITYAEDINMVFQASSGLEERVFFEEWQKLAYNPSTWDMGYYNDYVSVIDVYLLNRNNKRRFGLRLHEIFPKTIGATSLNQSANNEIIKISITFSFRYWSTLDIDRTSLSGTTDINKPDTVTINTTRNQPAVVAQLGGGRHAMHGG